jgi:hypothetical protein
MARETDMAGVMDADMLLRGRNRSTSSGCGGSVIYRGAAAAMRLELSTAHWRGGLRGPTGVGGGSSGGDGGGGVGGGVGVGWMDGMQRCRLMPTIGQQSVT